MAEWDIKHYLALRRTLLRRELFPFRHGEDEVEGWRRYFRQLGYGLGVYPRAEVKAEVGGLYGWFIEQYLRAGRPLPPINAKHVVSWVWEGYTRWEEEE